MHSSDNVVVGQYYRLHTPYDLSRCNGSILRIQSNRQGTVIWNAKPEIFDRPGDTWNLLEGDKYEELTDEEITLYLLCS